MKTLTASAALAVLLAASPAFCAAPKGLQQPGDPPPPPSEGDPRSGRESLSNFTGSGVTGDLFSMMTAYQKLMSKQAREDRKIHRQEVEFALKALERDRTALLAKEDASRLRTTFDDLRSKAMDAAVKEAPRTASLRDKAERDVLKAGESAIEKAIKAAEGLPADKRRGELEAAKAQAEFFRQQTQTLIDAAQDSRERVKSNIDELENLRKKLEKDGVQAAAILHAR